MPKALKISLIVFICLAVLTAIILPIVLKWDAIEGTIKNEAYYTYEDIKESYDKGYNEGSSNLNEFKEQLDVIKTQLDTKVNKVNELTQQVTLLTKENDELNSNKLENEELIRNLREEITVLKAENANLKVQVHTLTKNLNNANTLIEKQNIEIENYKLQVNNLQATVNDLTTEINRLQQLLESSNIDFENMVFVNFISDNQIWKTQLYEKNQTIEMVSSPLKAYCDFIGWTLNGEDVIDLTSQVLTEDKIFIAKFKVSDSAFVFTGIDSEGNRTKDESQIVEYLIGYGCSNNGMGGLYTSSDDHLGYLGKGLSKVEVPASYNGKPVTIIGDHAFAALKDIEEVILPNTIKIIGQFSFALSSLQTISFPSSVEEIHISAFRLCENLNNIVLPNNITSIYGGAFQGCYSLDNLVLNCEVTTIPALCFESCHSLKKVILPTTVETIGESAFIGCSNLSRIYFNEGLKTIGNYAFYNCISLNYIGFPSTIESLGKECFSAMRDKGVDIAFRSESFFSGFLANFSSTLRSSFNNNCLFVADNLIELYSQSEFSKYFDTIRGLTELEKLWGYDPWYWYD